MCWERKLKHIDRVPKRRREKKQRDRVIHAHGVSRFSAAITVFPLITGHVDGARCTPRARSIVIRGIVVGVVKT